MSQDLKDDEVPVECALHDLNPNLQLYWKKITTVLNTSLARIMKVNKKKNQINTMLKFFVFCIPKHGKGEVDHTGGVAKSTIR